MDKYKDKMITNEWIPGREDISIPLEIRSLVFGENGIKDGFDEYAMHILVSCGDDDVATGRIYLENDNSFYISHVCVKEEFRNMGIGDMTVKLLLFRGFTFAQYINAVIPCDLLKYFTKYGFGVKEEKEDGKVLISLYKDDVIYPSKCGGKHV